MTLRAMESFGHAPTGAVTSADLLSNQWTSIAGGLALVDLTGGRKYVYRTSGAGNLTLDLDSDLSTLVLGLRLHNIKSTTREYLAVFLDGIQVLGLLMKDVATSKLVYIRGASFLDPRILVSTAATAVGSNDHWTAKVVFDNVAGSVEFYQNGVLDSSVAGVDTINAGTDCDTIAIFATYAEYGTAGLSDIWVDDVTNHGETSVLYRPVDGVGSSADWTPTGAASNWECTDEVPPDDDTTYNASTTSSDLDQLAQAGMDGAVGSVLAVQAHVRARKETAAGATIKVGLLHGVTHSQSLAMALSTSYEQRTEIFEDVPGGAGWTSAQLDATQVSYENTT